jgi:hypothetical protein
VRAIQTIRIGEDAPRHLWTVNLFFLARSYKNNMSKSKIKSDAQAPANTGNALFSMVPTELWWKIVTLVAAGKASEAEEKLNALKHLSLASKATKKATMSIMGYVISLAPVRAVSTEALLKKMIYPEFAREVMATAENDSTALMPRIADLAADSKGAPVADALLKRLSASIRNATVNGAPMYGPAKLLDAHITEIMKRLKQNERFKKPPFDTYELHDSYELHDFVRTFLMLSADKRIEHMHTYGPMCLWDVSDVTNFYCVCEAQLLTAEPPTYLTFNSDLFWNTSAATTMSHMFHRNTEFRGDLSTWDVRTVKNMTSTFKEAGITNSGIGSWDVRSLEEAPYMFESALFLSRKLDFSLWNMQNCKNLAFMFLKSAIEDNNIGEWTLHRDANTIGMLIDAASFTGNLSKWRERHKDAAKWEGHNSDAAAVPETQSFGTTRSARTMEAQQTEVTYVRRLFAKALSAQGTEQQKKKEEQEERICAVQ